MSGDPFQTMARSDFGRLRTRETITRILSLLKARQDAMLSLGDVRLLLRPESETYRGMRTIPIARIVGSEGRYKDFNRAFLPRHDKLMRRWISVDMAHYQDISLPPIKVFEIGGAYFVRDGNHRVSVAKAKGAEFIDAEVISLSSEIPLTPDMGFDELKRAVIQFEKARFMETTGLDRSRPGCAIELTEVGRYDDLLGHIREHKWYINLRQSAEIPFEDAAVSWYDTVYAPIVQIVREARLLASFPRCTEADLYVYVGRHWSELGKRYGPLFTLEEAAEDFSITSRKKRLAHGARRWWAILTRLFTKRRETRTHTPRV
ncbi:MAG: transcriptional regulator [Spirochaetia bacterium]